MLRLERVLGNASDATFATRLHELRHADRVEVIRVEARDLGRRRLRVTTDHGTECAIALPRSARLEDGAILLADEHRAIEVRVGEPRWLRLRPRDAPSALRLGYAAGNLHWRVAFQDELLHVAIEGADIEAYRARLRPLVDDGQIEVLDE